MDLEIAAGTIERRLHYCLKRCLVRCAVPPWKVQSHIRFIVTSYADRLVQPASWTSTKTVLNRADMFHPHSIVCTAGIACFTIAFFLYDYLIPMCSCTYKYRACTYCSLTLVTPPCAQSGPRYPGPPCPCSASATRLHRRSFPPRRECRIHRTFAAPSRHLPPSSWPEPC